MTQNHASRRRYKDVDEREALHKSLGQACLGSHLPLHRKHNDFSHWLSDSNQRQGRWIPHRWKPTCLQRCKVYGTSDDGQPLLSSADSANIWFWSVDGNCLMKLQPRGSCLLVSLFYGDQNPKLFTSACQHLYGPCLPTLSPRECTLSWASLGKALEVGCVYLWKTRGILDLQNDDWICVLVGTPTPWQSKEFSCRY